MIRLHYPQDTRFNAIEELMFVERMVERNLKVSHDNAGQMILVNTGYIEYSNTNPQIEHMVRECWRPHCEMWHVENKTA